MLFFNSCCNSWQQSKLDFMYVYRNLLIFFERSLIRQINTCALNCFIQCPSTVLSSLPLPDHCLYLLNFIFPPFCFLSSTHPSQYAGASLFMLPYRFIHPFIIYPSTFQYCTCHCNICFIFYHCFHFSFSSLKRVHCSRFWQQWAPLNS